MFFPCSSFWNNVAARPDVFGAPEAQNHGIYAVFATLQLGSRETRNPERPLMGWICTSTSNTLGKKDGGDVAIQEIGTADILFTIMYRTRQWQKFQDRKHIGEVGFCE